LREGADRGGIVQDEDEVGQFKSDLTPKTRAGRGDRGRRGPTAISKSRDDHTRAKTTGTQETRFQDGQDSKSLGEARVSFATMDLGHRPSPLRPPESLEE
jgi:hypothetical protein